MFRNIDLHKLTRTLLVVVLLGLAGCAAGPTKSEGTGEKATVAQEPSYFEHTVRWPGENLALIAKWYTGDHKNWSVLAKENPGINPSAIRIGDVIKIPRNLMTNTDPMPKSAVKAQQEKRKRSQASKRPAEAVPGKEEISPDSPAVPSRAESPKESSEPELFGPKE